MKNSEKRQAMIGSGKTPVWLSEPYRPAAGIFPEMVGREKELRLVTAAWIGSTNYQPMSPLLVGEPGTGKNRLVYELAGKSGRDLYILQGHEDVTAEDFACGVRLSGENGEKTISYILSPLATAMLEGGVCFIDEIGKIRPRALAMLVSVLDERRYLDSTLLGERIPASFGFRFIAATNSNELHSLPEFIRSRMCPTITVQIPKREEINMIIGKHFPESSGYLKNLLDAFWSLWREHTESGNRPTPREAVHVFALASNLSDLEFQEKNTLELKRCGVEASRIDERKKHPIQIRQTHIEDAFVQLFPKNGDASQEKNYANAIQ